MSDRRRAAHTVLAVGVACAACGPIGYVRGVSRDATHAVEAARDAGAEHHAPYWWTRATQYLAMAREIAAHADFQGANRFGRLAAEAADRATAEAQAAAKDPARRPREGGPIAPAKDAPVAPVAPAKGAP
jgi:hypothetical protein